MKQDRWAFAPNVRFLLAHTLWGNFFPRAIPWSETVGLLCFSAGLTDGLDLAPGVLLSQHRAPRLKFANLAGLRFPFGEGRGRENSPGA